MGDSQSISLRGLFTAFKRVISPTPLAELSLIRHHELGSAEDEALWRSDMDYLQGLASAICDELDDGGFLWEMPLPVLSETVLAGLKQGLDAAFWRFAHTFEDAA